PWTRGCVTVGERINRRWAQTHADYQRSSVRIERLHRLDNAEKWTDEGLLLWIPDAFEVPRHGGVEVRAIVEFHPLPQLEHLNPAVILQLLGFRQLGNVVQVLIDRHQIIAQVPGYIRHLEAGGPMRVKAGDVLLSCHRPFYSVPSSSALTWPFACSRTSLRQRMEPGAKGLRPDHQIRMPTPEVPCHRSCGQQVADQNRRPS